jgi:hypothetical protein
MQDVIVGGLGAALFAEGDDGLIGLIGQDKLVEAQCQGGREFQQGRGAGEVHALHPVGHGLAAHAQFFRQLFLVPAFGGKSRSDGLAVDNFVHRRGIVVAGASVIK